MGIIGPIDGPLAFDLTRKQCAKESFMKFMLRLSCFFSDVWGGDLSHTMRRVRGGAGTMGAWEPEIGFSQFSKIRMCCFSSTCLSESHER